MAIEEVVAYRIRIEGQYAPDIVCMEVECLMHYANELATVATPMTQDDIEEYQSNCDGIAVSCASCMKPLDLHNMQMAW